MIINHSSTPELQKSLESSRQCVCDLSTSKSGFKCEGVDVR